MTVNVLFRGHGVYANTMKRTEVVIDMQIGAMIGNAMSQTVLEAILTETFRSVKLYRNGQSESEVRHGQSC